ncbi:MAG: ABC transporter permease [Pirellulales bacterium]
MAVAVGTADRAVAAFFALIASFTVPDLQTLGFLGVLVCFWMGASQALLSIVGERSVFEHERLTFLRVRPYLLAKYIWSFLVGAAQVAVFYTASCALRSSCGAPPHDDPAPTYYADWTAWYVWLPFVLCNWSGVALGTMISAAARRTERIANFLLPLFMVGQIVFGFFVGGTASRATIDGLRTLETSPLEYAQSEYAARYRAAWGAADTISQWCTVRSADEILRTFAYAKPESDEATFADPRAIVRREELEGRYEVARRWAYVRLVVGMIALPIMLCRVVLAVQERFAYWIDRRR